ncbi:hypothetical protein [Neisseria yangbaofengii]|uniref:hypothetical protein n=1 Tax=Neisseria yangbaofengii TaxID=2709396 RepID=UPI0013EA99FD|nr:hypothetical protein [Neisseria yangbaofengii]
MKRKTAVFCSVMALMLSGCAQYDDFMGEVSTLKNQTAALFGGEVDKTPPAQICKEHAENNINAQRKYIGKMLIAKGKVLRIYKDELSGIVPRAGTVLENTYRTVMQVGSVRINAGMSSLVAQRLKVGQTVTLKGQIESLGFDDTGFKGEGCLVALRYSIPVTKK